MSGKMTAPICEFAKRYEKSGVLRLHMPGHKGMPVLGPEALDITEIRGADSLFEAQGIIAESEANASRLFGCKTFYSTEGSSLCIRAMLCLIAQNTPKRGEKIRILAGRNAHKTFLGAAALLDLEVDWLYPTAEESYLSCTVTPEDLEAVLSESAQKPAAVYITSPDYLGNVADIKGLAAVCHAHGAYLLVDNAHGAYLKLLQPSAHPIDLGADLCCDSAHKTLPVLTGGAYLHISHHVAAPFAARAKAAMALFASTSPSYLILQSLDAANVYLAQNKDAFVRFLPHAESAREKLTEHGYSFGGNEPLKWTLKTKSYGYDGIQFSDILREHGVECEFADADHVVLMLSPFSPAGVLDALTDILTAIPQRLPVLGAPPPVCRPVRVLTPKEALLSAAECLPASACEGRVLADMTVGCPPAVPILCCGERIDKQAIAAFTYYGISACNVVK